MHAPAHNRLRHRGMNFAEVLFAVMILGIGFIMVAAIFPVAIQQSKSSANDTMGVRVTQSALEAIRAKAVDDGGTQRWMPVTDTVDTDIARVYPVTHAPAAPNDPGAALWTLLQGDFISGIDPRFGFAALYRRGSVGANARDFAQVFIIPMQVQNHSEYEPADVATRFAFSPIPVTVELSEEGSNPDRLAFDVAEVAAAEGAVVILADDPDTDPAKKRNGRILRLARQVSDTVWELELGWDLRSDIDESTTAGPVEAFMIGRGMDADLNYVGPSQAITVYTTTVPVRRTP